MTTVNQETLTMLEILPKSDQILAQQLIKKLVLAWDPDFTKLTPSEEELLKVSEKEILNGETYSMKNVLSELGISKNELK